MNPDSQINSSFWIMIIIRTFGSVDMPGSGDRKLPAPGTYVPVIVAWAVLQVAADAGFSRGASRLGWLFVLAVTVLGPFGQKLVSLFNWVGTQYAPPVVETTPIRVQPGG